MTDPRALGRSFELDLVGRGPGWLHVRDGELVVDLPRWFTAPWKLPAEQVAMIDWWSRTREVFRARFGDDAYEPDRRLAVGLRARRFRDLDLAVWLREPGRLPPRRPGGLRSPFMWVGRRSEVTGVCLTVAGEPTELKRELERWGASFRSEAAPE